jgi:hypothetical protein
MSSLVDFFKGKHYFNTHDQTWVRQLKYIGFVSKKGVVEIYNWRIDTRAYDYSKVTCS